MNVTVPNVLAYQEQDWISFCDYYNTLALFKAREAAAINEIVLLVVGFVLGALLVYTGFQVKEKIRRMNEL